MQHKFDDRKSTSNKRIKFSVGLGIHKSWVWLDATRIFWPNWRCWKTHFYCLVLRSMTTLAQLVCQMASLMRWHPVMIHVFCTGFCCQGWPVAWINGMRCYLIHQAGSYLLQVASFWFARGCFLECRWDALPPLMGVISDKDDPPSVPSQVKTKQAAVNGGPRKHHTWCEFFTEAVCLALMSFWWLPWDNRFSGLNNFNSMIDSQSCPPKLSHWERLYYRSPHPPSSCIIQQLAAVWPSSCAWAYSCPFSTINENFHYWKYTQLSWNCQDFNHMQLVY